MRVVRIRKRSFQTVIKRASQLARMVATTGLIVALSANMLPVSALADVAMAANAGILHSVGEGIYRGSEKATVADGQLIGVDVSNHDGRIDWDLLKSSGVDFAIIRCGYGSSMEGNSRDDTMFTRNVAECERLGIPYGIYLYSYADTEGWVRLEAEHAIRKAKECNPTLGIWYDIEEPRQAWNIGMNPTWYANAMRIFRETVEAETGYKVGVYSNKQYFDSYLSDSYFDEVPRWHAQWATSISEGYDHVMWQAGSIRINGHDFDFDVADELPSMVVDTSVHAEHVIADINSSEATDDGTSQVTATPAWTNRSADAEAVAHADSQTESDTTGDGQDTTSDAEMSSEGANDDDVTTDVPVANNGNEDDVDTTQDVGTTQEIIGQTPDAATDETMPNDTQDTQVQTPADTDALSDDLATEAERQDGDTAYAHADKPNSFLIPRNVLLSDPFHHMG